MIYRTVYIYYSLSNRSPGSIYGLFCPMGWQWKEAGRLAHRLGAESYILL
jgi:hypothetical protein